MPLRQAPVRQVGHARSIPVTCPTRPTPVVTIFFGWMLRMVADQRLRGHGGLLRPSQWRLFTTVPDATVPQMPEPRQRGAVRLS